MTREYLIERLWAVTLARIDATREPLLRQDYIMYTEEEKRLRKLLGWGRNRP